MCDDGTQRSMGSRHSKRRGRTMSDPQRHHHRPAHRAGPAPRAPRRPRRGDVEARQREVPRTGPLRFARMTGSSIAGRDAAPWVTDFLNAAYYRRAADERDVDDLRLAFCILTTYWYRDAPSAGCTSPTSPRSTAPSARSASAPTSSRARDAEPRAAAGAAPAALIGDWFPDAYADDARRGWGIAFPTVAGARRLRPGAPPAARPPGRAHAGERAARRAGLAHLPAGRMPSAEARRSPR